MKKQESKFEQVISLYPIVHEACKRYWQLGPEDLAQDVAVKLLKYKGMIPANPGRAWVNLVVRNAAMDKFTQLKKEQTVVDGSVGLDINGDFSQGAQYKTYVAHEIYAQQEADEATLKAIHAAFEALPEAQREVLQLHCDGKSYSEIAAITQANIGTVRSRLHYGRSKAQELLAAYR